MPPQNSYTALAPDPRATSATCFLCMSLHIKAKRVFILSGSIPASKTHCPMVFTSAFLSRPLSISLLRILIPWRPVPSLLEDFSYPLIFFSGVSFGIRSLIRHPLPCTRFRSFFSSFTSYSLFLLLCVSLRFWWTVPSFLLVYLCEVLLYDFIIASDFYLSTHFLKNF